MRVLVVCQYYFPEPFRISDICESLARRGHEVTVLTGLPNYPEGRVLDDYRYGKKRDEVINGVRVIRSFEVGRGRSHLTLFLNYLSFAVSASIKAVLIQQEFDAIFVNQLSPVLMALPAIAYKKRWGKRLLLYCLDLWPDSLAAGGINEGSRIYRIFHGLSKWIYREADEVLVSSSMFIDYFRNTLGLTGKSVKHLPQYAEDLFSQTPARTDRDGHSFVFAGNIGDMQSVETIVLAANELRSHADIMFHIVGDGSRLGACIQLVGRLGLTNVTFYGRRPVEEMPQYYSIADAMLVTLKNNRTLSYTLPGKVQSYMAAGKPIIGAADGEVWRIIERSECGLCCAAEDYKGLADLILEFCNSSRKEEMGTKARSFYRDHYSQERFIAELEEALYKVGG